MVQPRKGQHPHRQMECNRDLLRAIVDSSPDAVAVKDRKGRYLKINTAGARLLGRPARDVIGRDDSELLPPGAAVRAAETDRVVRESGRPLTYEALLRPPGAMKRRYRVTKGPCGDGFMGTTWVLAFDITQGDAGLTAAPD